MYGLLDSLQKSAISYWSKRYGPTQVHQTADFSLNGLKNQNRSFLQITFFEAFRIPSGAWSRSPEWAQPPAEALLFSGVFFLNLESSILQIAFGNRSRLPTKSPKIQYSHKKLKAPWASENKRRSNWHLTSYVRHVAHWQLLLFGGRRPNVVTWSLFTINPFRARTKHQKQ